VGGDAIRAQTSAAQDARARNYDARSAVGAIGLSTVPGAGRQSPRLDAIAGQLAGLTRLQSTMPGLVASVDQWTGATRSVYNATGYLTEPLAGSDVFDAGVAWLVANHDALGLVPDDLIDVEVTDRVYSSVTGATHLYLRQRVREIPVYNGQLHLNINRDGRLIGVNNQFVPNLAAVARRTAPAITAAAAVERALRHWGTSASAVQMLAPPIGPRQTTSILNAGISAAPIEAALYWLPIQPGEVRLVWNFNIQSPAGSYVHDYTVDAETGLVWTRLDWTAGDSYKVYGRPVESPNHTTPLPPEDGRGIVANPAHSTASPFGWHDVNGIAGADYTVMRGNNVHAYDDTDANNLPPANEPACGGSLNCSFAADFTQDPSVNLPAAIANLFYWNNVVHDVQYLYGFDEVAGNFQVNNYGRGGAANDDVRAEALDGSGVNNASMTTFPDGQRGWMQMYRWNHTTPNRASDFDAGVVVHEYGHGISNRLVGGPSNVSCLGNIQQPGEGLSDWWALVYTATAAHTGVTPRGIGTYVLGHAAGGRGIRTLPYSTDQSVNSWTYQSIRGFTGAHAIGQVWAQAAWEVYWALVDRHGFSSNLYAATEGAGNHRAMLYVNEGLKNTACSPAFTDVRDGIIQAVIDNYGGEDVCTVWNAFAAFGLGVDAVSGGVDSNQAIDGFARPASCGGHSPDLAVADATVDEGDDGTSTAAVQVTLSTASASTVTVSYTTEPGTASSTTYSNDAPIALPSGASASAAAPYPSTIHVPAVSASITKVTATLRRLTHTWPPDADVLLVAPNGQSVLLMSDVGGAPAVGTTLVFDDDGAPLTTAPLASGTYRPTNLLAGDGFPSPAPGGDYGSALSAFNGLNPTGDWKLFVVDDDSRSDSGTIESWSLVFQVSPASGDYSSTSGRLSFAPGETSKTILVPIVGDVEEEGSESFTVRLSSAVNAVITDPAATVTILDDENDASPAAMLSPAPNATLSGSATFTWTSGRRLTTIWLDVGTSIGGTDIYSASQGSSTSQTVTNIPANGAAIWARLWSLTPSGWSHADYAYTAPAPVPGAIIAPGTSGRLAGTTATFSWTSGAGVKSFWIDVGSSEGAADIYSGSQGVARSRRIDGLPHDGSAVYVRLWSLTSAGWSFSDYAYQAYSATSASLTGPVAGATLPGSTARFEWTVGPAVSVVWLDVGTSAGGNNVYGGAQGIETSRVVTGLPSDGSTVFARLWSLAHGVWLHADYQFRAYGGALAALSSPVAGTVLERSHAQFSWTAGAGVSEVRLDVGSTIGATNYYSSTEDTGTTRLVPGLPRSGSPVSVRLWSRAAGTWRWIDYTFTAATFVPAGLTEPTSGSTLEGSTVTFRWTPGRNVAVIWLDVGTTEGGSDVYGGAQNTFSRVIEGIPVDGRTVYARVWSLLDGAWQFTDYAFSAARLAEGR
jgi:extracellular elastinolytic metalloproteinase